MLNRIDQRRMKYTVALGILEVSSIFRLKYKRLENKTAFFDKTNSSAVISDDTSYSLTRYIKCKSV